jgi:hypothetical protein
MEETKTKTKAKTKTKKEGGEHKQPWHETYATPQDIGR